MSRPSGGRLGAAALLALAGTVARPLAAQEPAPAAFRVERAVSVAAPGWTKLRLDAAARARMQPDARDLRLRDGAGRELPTWLVSEAPAPPPPPRHPRVVDVSESPEGWWLVLDLGEGPPAHRRLRLDFVIDAVVSPVRLESSPDGRQWAPLATGKLIDVGGPEVQRADLAYRPTTDRYLRLAWPREAGEPDLRGAQVEPLPARDPGLAELPLAITPLTTGPGFAEYRLGLPGTGLAPEALALDWSGAGLLGYRLQRPLAGDWVTLAEGLLPAGMGELPLDGPGAGGSEGYRLELRTGGDAAPRLHGASARARMPWLVFHAEAPGAYRLRYGALGLAPPTVPPGPPPIDLSEAVEAGLGAAVEQPPPPLPAAVTAPGAALDAAGFDAAWPVTAPGAAAGELARLELPDAVYGEARADLADIRLLAAGRRLPQVLQPLAEPRPLLAASGLTPRPLPEPGSSYLLLPLAEVAGLPVSRIELAAPAAPFARGVTAAYLLGEGGPALPRHYETAPIGSRSWTCAGQSVEPCRLTFAADGAPSAWLLLTFDDGDNAPLAGLEVRAWRRGHALLFPWPGGPVQLLAGHPDLGPAQYDLAGLADQLAAYPSREARLEGAAAPPPPGPWKLPPELQQWALALAIALGAGLLLLVLARVLRSPEG